MYIGVAVLVSLFAAEEVVTCLEYVRFARYHRQCVLSSFRLIILAGLCSTTAFTSPVIIFASEHGVVGAFCLSHNVIIVIASTVCWILSIPLIFVATTDHVFVKNRYQLIQMLCTNLQQASWRVIRSPWRVLLSALTNKCGGLIAAAAAQSLVYCSAYMFISSSRITLHSASNAVIAFIVITLWNVFLFMLLYRALVFYPTSGILRISSSIITTANPILLYVLFRDRRNQATQFSSSDNNKSMIFSVITISFVLLCLVKSIVAADARQRLQHLLRSEPSALTGDRSVIEEVSISLRRKRAERRQVQVHPLTSLPRIHPTQTTTTPTAAFISMRSMSDVSDAENAANQL